MKTRKEYLNGECTHREFWAQFVDKRVKAHVANYIGRDAIISSTDPHLNDIPIAKWDHVGRLLLLPITFESVGDYCTLSSLVCIAKEAARQIKEEN